MKKQLLALCICLICSCFFLACGQNESVNKIGSEIKKSVTLERDIVPAKFNNKPKNDPDDSDRLNAKAQLTEDQLNTLYEYKKTGIQRLNVKLYQKENPNDAVILSRVPEGLVKATIYSHDVQPIADKYLN